METNAVASQNNAKLIDLAEIKRKSRFSGKVIKTTLAGAIVDIGLETPGVVHISQLQEQPTNRVEDVVKVGQKVEVWVRRVDPKKKRIDLTMIEPMALEWREIVKGMVVKGKVTRLEKFGVFVDIGAERPGLVHISEMTHDYIKSPGEVVKEGDEIDVQVLEVNRRKRQIRLSMKALEEKPVKASKAAPQSKSKEPVEEAAKEVPTPTAMEMALREAMERSKGTEQEVGERGKARRRTSTDEMGQILSRTLQNKVRSSR